MAGTLFGLPLSQRVDLNGLPSIGWLLYVYQANTSTPVNSYQDTALTVLNPWPIAANSSGMMRQFWVADGSYRARATNADGSLTYFDQPSILALGASAGTAPSGGVDANAIYQTGDITWSDKSGAKTGWVRDNGRTIGSGTSGADERANNDCQALFEFLWNTFSDTVCPVVTGRGGSSLADWTANKKITLPDHRGCTPIGADGMGNSSSGRFSGVPVISGAIDTPGSVVGENTHTLTTAELASHSHTANVTDPGHFHSINNVVTTLAGAAAVRGTSLQDVGQNTNSATTGISVAITNTGSGTAHNITGRSIIVTVYRKL